MNSEHIPKHLLPPKIPRLVKSNNTAIPFVIKRHFLMFFAAAIFPFLGFDYFDSDEEQVEDEE